jgi:hypothetical protein
MLSIVALVLLALAVISVSWAYSAARDDALASSMRFRAMNDNVKALEALVKDFKDDVSAEFSATDAGVVRAANHTMRQLNGAIRREALQVTGSLGQNRRAVAALKELLDENARTLKEMMETMDVEDKALALQLQLMGQMQSRHQQVVAYLSGNGLTSLAANMEAALEPFSQGFEGFDNGKMRDAMTAFGVQLDDAQLAQLDADLQGDVETGLSLKEALFVRLSALRPVADKVKENETAKKEQAEADVANAFEEIQRTNLAHREAIKSAMAGMQTVNKRGMDAVTSQIQTELKASEEEVAGLVNRQAETLNAAISDVKALNSSTNAKVAAMVKGQLETQSTAMKVKMLEQEAALKAATAETKALAAANAKGMTDTIKAQVALAQASMNDRVASQEAKLRETIAQNMAKIEEMKAALAKVAASGNVVVSAPNPAASCYGAATTDSCVTCDDVVRAYQAKGWAFDRKNFAQCSETTQSAFTATTSKPYLWMDGGSWQNGTWTDKSGNGRHSSKNVGIAVAKDPSGFAFIHGGSNSGLELAPWPQGDYTFFHVTRYNGGTRGRIWNGSANNWLSGHHDKTAGRVHHDRWLEPLVNPGVSADAWLLVTDQRSYARINGTLEGRAAGNGPGRAVGINQGGYPAANERSDWACAEVVVFDKNLSGAEIASVESYLAAKYGLKSGAVGKLSEQKYRGYYSDNRAFFDGAQKDGAAAATTSIKKGNEGARYSYKWTGALRPKVSGTHEFWTRSDDASHVYVNSALVVNNGGLHGAQDRSGAIDLVAGKSYSLEVLLGQNEGGAEMWLQWHGPGQGWQTDMSTILG